MSPKTFSPSRPPHSGIAGRVPALFLLAASLVSIQAADAPGSNGKATPSPLDLARQLNQAFVDVAAQVTPAVVVVKVAHRPSKRQLSLENHPFFEMLPEEFREQLEEPSEPRQPRDNSERNGERRRGRPPRRDQRPSPQREPNDSARPESKSEPKESRESQEPVFDGEGSGLIVRKEGYIVTNRHVVEDADKVKIRLVDGQEFDATVRGMDVQSDLAVLKIEPGTKPLTVARFGDSHSVRVGEFAIAIGAPLDLDYSVTFGHISAKGRSRILNDPSLDQDFLQTDANINPGNSGGPLVNLEGEIIGINTLIRGLRTGIGFAIPANLVREVSDQLIASGHFTRAYLGVRIHSLRESEEYRDSIPNVKDGVVVFAIPPGSPAAKSELKAGDIILAVDGHAVASPQELRNEIRSKTIGAPVSLEVHRFGQNLKVAVRPEAWPEQDEPKVIARREPAKESSEPPEEPASFGLKVENLTRDLAEHFNVKRSAGVIVTEVERNSVAQKQGLRPGDIITEVNQKPVGSVKQFNEALRKSDPKRSVIIHFQTDGTSRFEVLPRRKD